jgi:hypothetical protein
MAMDEKTEGAYLPGHLIPPPPLIPPSPVKRPVSVIVIALLFFIGAALECSGLFQPSHISSTMTTINHADSIVFMTLQILVGIGLLILHPAARTAAIVALVLRYLTTIPEGIIEITGTPTVMFTAQLATFVVVLSLMTIYFSVLIFFLTRPYMKTAFGR